MTTRSSRLRLFDSGVRRADPYSANRFAVCRVRRRLTAISRFRPWQCLYFLPGAARTQLVAAHFAFLPDERLCFLHDRFRASASAVAIRSGCSFLMRETHSFGLFFASPPFDLLDGFGAFDLDP